MIDPSQAFDLSSLTRLEIDTHEAHYILRAPAGRFPNVVDLRVNHWVRSGSSMNRLRQLLADVGRQVTTLHLLSPAADVGVARLNLDIPRLCPRLRTLALDPRWTGIIHDLHEEGDGGGGGGGDGNLHWRRVDWSGLELDLLLLGSPLTDPHVASPDRLLSHQHATAYLKAVELLRPRRVALAKLDLGASRRWTAGQWDEVCAFAGRVSDDGRGSVLEDRFGRVVAVDGGEQGQGV